MAGAIIGLVVGKAVSLVAEKAVDEVRLAFGAKKELEKLARNLAMIDALLSDAESKQLTNPAVQLWLKRLQSIGLDAEIVLDEFGYEVLGQKIESRKRDKVRNFFSTSNPFLFYPNVAHKIKDITSSLEEVYAESKEIGLQPVNLNSLPVIKEERYTDPYVEDSEIVGRDDDTANVIKMLLGSDYGMELPVIAIQGMGGQGKTTLAQLVYKNDIVQSHFAKRIWLCVSDEFNVERLLAEMLQSLAQTNHQLTSIEGLVHKLKEQLSGNRCLLVLDDVWNDDRDKWERMRRCLLQIGDSKGSRVLITTRSEDVVLAVQAFECHRLQILSEDESWTLFEKRAFAKGGATKSPELVDIGKRILRRCGGVPLAIKAIGGLLYSKKSVSGWSMIESSEMWRDFHEGDKVLSAIRLSYDHLPSSSLKQCFASLAIFEKDTLMKKDMLIKLWMAHGWLGSSLQLEDRGDEYFNVLLRSSLLQGLLNSQNDIRYCKMHDLVHDVSLKVSKNYCFQVKDWTGLRDTNEAVHLSIVAGERGMPRSLKDIFPSKLRTLHLKGHYVLEDLFENFKSLSVLILEDYDRKGLPNSIGKMKHLRFLDICRTRIRRLPKSITLLYYLQTLEVDWLEEIPKGFHKLINLRHFQFQH